MHEQPHLYLQVCLITGGNSGIGFETAAEMAKKGCHIILACRNVEKADHAAEVIIQAPAPKATSQLPFGTSVGLLEGLLVRR